MGGRFLFLCYLAYFIYVPKTGAIDVDYYMTSLRTGECKSEEGEEACKAYCQDRPFSCYRGQCSCEEIDTTPRIKILIFDPKHLVKYNTDKSPEETQNQEREMLQRPALRHHIAHFCPNLKVARVCIRKCMEKGKPAFCGKDHTCYCGHKYTPHDKNSIVNADEVYKNFQDLYEKYFGRKPAGEDTIVESKD